MRKLRPIILFIALLLNEGATCCEQWIQLASFSGAARHRCTAFSVGNKGYIGGGHINSGVEVVHEDYWQYDPGSNSWTQIADFGGGKRYQSVAFGIGEFGYVGCGEDENDNYYNDFYRYVPSLNVWQPIPNYPGNPRRGASSFVLNNHGYVGTGQSDFGYEEDFYRFVPDSNAWFGIADFLGEARSSAVAFAYNGRGYVGTGHVIGDDTRDFYEYEPMTNTWVQKSDVGNVDRQDATGFVINGKGYIATGNDVNADFNYKDVWEYNFDTDTWIRIEDFCGEGRRYMVSFVIGDIAFAGTGTDGTNLKDFWMFNPILGTDEALIQWHAPYPNPSSNLIYFDGLPESSTLKIYALDGRLVWTSTLVHEQLQLSKNEIGTGQFMYLLEQENGFSQHGKIVFE